MTTYALRSPGDPRPSIWCTGEWRDDCLHFDVINGGWSGVWEPEGFLSIKGDSDSYPAEIVWQGDVPQEFAGDYNLAISWIAGEIAKARKSEVAQHEQAAQSAQSASHSDGTLETLSR